MDDIDIRGVFFLQNLWDRWTGDHLFWTSLTKKSKKAKKKQSKERE
jgi:hypothetical protein